MTSLRARLRHQLLSARRARDRPLVAALSSAIGAIENAEAVPAAPTAGADGSTHVAGAAVGLGATEAPRRTLGATEEHAILAAEVADLVRAAGEYDDLGLVDEAATARRVAAALQAVPAGPAVHGANPESVD